MAATTNGDAAAVLEDIKPPQGVVLPPKEFRTILEKTAGFVARNGIVFEDRIREKERNNPKFSFLSNADPYNPYYLWRLSEIKEGRGNAVSAGRAGEAAAPVEQKPVGPPQPPDFKFSARMPNISAQDLEVVKLTALFVAKNGRQFMTNLSQRETGNYQFEFLRPNHSLHNFFQHLVDQYSMLLRAGGIDGEGGRQQQERVAELQRNVDDKFHVLARARQRAEWLKYQESQKIQKEEEEEKEREVYAQIDWHDFVVVETVVFNDADDQANLPPPTSLNDLQYASLEQKARVSVGANFRIEEGFPSEEDSVQAYQQQQQQQMPAPQPGYGMAPPPRPNGFEDEESARIREREEARARLQQAQADAKGGAAPIKIRENYVPRAAARAASRQAAQMALCPTCNQQIPVDELAEHMRIELLDPRWKEQKAKQDSRAASTNMAPADAANHLKRLASSRTDIFDPATGQPISEEELARRKRAALNSYDGVPDARNPGHQPQMQSTNVSEQIRAIHQRYAPNQ
ncbi:Pre-mRNA splicing factor PRP21 like protein-domain-containing protein [Truncatella angustata]|uniref:Pre-mRNA splicing factor PRP21 like protein-domain-containing protein n=1 Tax=Truncatella angustata TaxID=152316 RepID=A0A9P8UGK6_9PEZI|nr:Pre-mRNA splicing factor PRP21 like protein-domain-containing protein [Truncatella angustata]KAH6651718.1 Pre-mRNA splicing factor PRP21 like protein-domain-containing protein [Truncatella angustata]